MSTDERAILAAAVLALSACGAPKPASSGPTKVVLPVPGGARPPATAAEPRREPPPPSGTTKASPFPSVTRTTLGNGLNVDAVTSRALPLVQVRLLVRAGAGYGAHPAVGQVTAQMLKEGGTRVRSSMDLVRRIETLGSELSVQTDEDATVLAMALTTDKLSEGLALLAEVVEQPRFDAEELRKLEARMIDEAEDAARSSGSFTGMGVLFRELYPDGSPYRARGALPSDIAKVSGADVRAFHERFYVPKNAVLVLAGDIDGTSAKKLADKHFGGWAGGAPPAVAFPPPSAPAQTRVLVADRPKSAQSDVFVGMLAPPRRSADWATVRVANQVLGGGVASRLFADVREQRSLAYRTGAQILQLAEGAQPLVLYAGTEPSKTVDAVAALLDNLERMKASPPTREETETAGRYLSDIFSVRMETLGAIAEMVVAQESLGLPDGYYDQYRSELRATEAKDVDAVVSKLYAEPYVIVVAGDASVVAEGLTRFGDVTVVDPDKEYAPVKTLPKAVGQ